jgi:hypothetical protein
MSNQNYKLPKEIDHYLATLSKTYKYEGSITKLEIIANAQVRSEVGRTYYERDGGTHGHALFLGVPESVYLDPTREYYETEIASDLNKINKVQNEFIEEVFIEAESRRPGLAAGGKFQALQCNWGEAPIRIAQLLIKQPKAVDAFIAALRLCSQFEEGNTLSRLLPSIDKISQKQETDLISVFNTNYELRGSFGFNGRYPYKHGGGLPELLKRTRGSDYALDDDKEFLISIKA